MVVVVVVVVVVVLRVVVLTLGNLGRFALAVGTNLEYFIVVVGLGGYVTFSVEVASVEAVLLEPYFFLYISEKLIFLVVVDSMSAKKYFVSRTS